MSDYTDKLKLMKKNRVKYFREKEIPQEVIKQQEVESSSFYDMITNGNGWKGLLPGVNQQVYWDKNIAPRIQDKIDSFMRAGIRKGDDIQMFPKDKSFLIGEPTEIDRSYMMPQDDIRNPNGFIGNSHPIDRAIIANIQSKRDAPTNYPPQQVLPRRGLPQQLQREPLSVYNIMNADLGSPGRGIDW